ncbi:MAG: phosphatidate cytidylyltransferase, partial [Chloroflexota bacterium]
MLKQRVLVVVLLLPIVIAAIMQGGWVLGLLISLLLGMAVWEYSLLFKAGGLKPAGFLVVAGVVLLTLTRTAQNLEYDSVIVVGLAMLLMAIHLREFEKGRDQAGSDFAASLSGLIYIGFLGGYMVLLRNLPEGQWWLLTVLPAVWLADSGAYFIGKRFGVHKMAPRLSPKKSWEGYFGGIVVALIGTPLLMSLYHNWGLPVGGAFTPLNAVLIGLVMGVFPTLGDLGESMLKRQFGVKDSGSILPGHGGIFDRIDSWLWAVTIGYYLIT